MRNFVLGFLAASVLFGGYIAYDKLRHRDEEPVVTATDGGPAVDAGAVTKKKRRWRRRVARRSSGEPAPSGGSATADDSADIPSGRTVSAAELKPSTQGDRLDGTQVISMEEKESGGRELSQSDLDGVFNDKRQAVLDCIDKSRGDAAAHPGRVVVGLRIARSGSVAKLRVSGPSYMMKAGLHGCVRRVVGSLRFPQPASSMVVSFPFELR